MFYVFEKILITSYTNVGFSATAKHKWFFVVKVTSSDNHDALFTFNTYNPTLQVILFNMSGSGVFSGEYMNPGNALTGNSSNLLNQSNMSLELECLIHKALLGSMRLLIILNAHRWIIWNGSGNVDLIIPK